MQKSIVTEIRSYMKIYEMLRPGDRVIAAVSGGADSVCLLWALQKIAPELPAFLRVVHVHHGLRGEEADRDERFVEDLCRKLEIPFQTVRCNAAEYAKDHGMSTEEAGRVLRYEALEEAAKTWEKEAGADFDRPVKIAVAHHREDSAETVLHNLLRGSGLRGLSGIRPVQGRLIRPLLSVSREDICAWLESEGVSWCEDSTNQSEAYTRNVIRRRILPLMREAVNQKAEENILRAADIMAQADRYLEQQAERVWEQGGRLEQAENGKPEADKPGAEGGESKAEIGESRAEERRPGKTEDGTCRVSAEIDSGLFLEQEEIIQTYLLRRMLDAAAPGWKDITSRHFAALTALARNHAGSRMDLPCGLAAEKTYETLRIYRKSRSGKTAEEGSLLFTERRYIREGEELCLEVEISAERIQICTFSREKAGEIPKNQYTKWFDYDKIKNMLSYRHRRPGDFLVLAGGGKKTVARCMIDDKIPRGEREQIPVLAEGNHVLWVVGGRISEYYKITDQTKTILQVTYNGGEEHGR